MVRRTRLLPLLLAFGSAWLLFGLLVAPSLLRSAYHGESLPVLNALLAPYRDDHALSFFLQQLQYMAIFGCLACIAYAGLAYLLLSPQASRRVVGEATPGTVGAIRMLVCGILLASTVWEDVSSSAYIPRELIRPMGLLQLFYLIPGFDRFAASPFALDVFQWLTALVLFAGLIGWKTRWTLPAGAIAYLILGGLLRQYAWFYHTGLIPFYLLIVLCLIPSQDGWSVDRLVRLWRGQRVAPNTPTLRYGWARYALWTALALPYVAAALSKLRTSGLAWWEADNFRNILFQSTLQPMEFNFQVSLLLTSAPDFVFQVMALSALLGELCYGLVLFFPWARRVFPVLMMFMHVGILFLQNILFFDLILLQLIFFNLAPLRQRVAQHLTAQWGSIRLAYNSAAEPSVRLVRVLRALDLFKRIRFIDAPTHSATASTWSAAYGGTMYRGASLYRLLARSLPALWGLVPLLYLPGVPTLIDRLLSSPQLPAVRAPGSSVELPLCTTPGTMLRMGSPRLVLALAAVLFVCWVFRVEFYPFTAMQMFSKKRPPVVTYETAVAHLQSGAAVRAPLEQCIRAMADSRYRRLLTMAFDEEQAILADQYFGACVDRWNRKVPPSEMIARLEVQRWEWDFRADPDPFDHGHLVARKVFPVESASYASE